MVDIRPVFNQTFDRRRPANSGIKLTLLVAGSWLPLLVAGGLLTTPPLDISRSEVPILKIQTAFDSIQRDLHCLKNSNNVNRGVAGAKTANCRLTRTTAAWTRQ